MTKATQSLASAVFRSRYNQFPIVARTSFLRDIVSIPYRSLATADQKGDGRADNNIDDDASLSYFERKLRAKEKRRDQYRRKVERAAKAKYRRQNSPRDVLKNEFRSWWIGRKVMEEKLDRKSRQAGMNWTLQVATIVERLPIVLPDKEDFEVEFENLQAYLMAHRGKDYPKEFTGETDGNKNVPEAYTDEELLALLPENFKPAPRETEADKNGNTSTLERRLKERVYLLVDGSFPRTEVVVPGQENVDDIKNESESLLEAALRGLKENISPVSAGGNKNKIKKNNGRETKLPLDLYCPSQAPIAVRLEPYDEGEREKTGRYGTKTFFMKVQYDDGALKENDKFSWLTRSEIVSSMDGSEEAKFYHYLL